MLSQKINVIVVDDEPPARQRIRNLIKEYDQLELVAECANGYQAVKAIIDLKPKLIFLDIQMPEFGGFEVIKTIGVENMPAIVFVTAYDKYALKAFDVNACDYLLKPFDKSRFNMAVKKALKDISLSNGKNSNNSLNRLLEDITGGDKTNKRLLIKTSGRVSIINVDQIDWVNSAGNYVEIHIGNEVYLKRITMKKMEERLGSNMFIRIHRFTIVNIDKIKEFHPHFNGDFIVILKSGKRLTLSRRYRRKITKLLGNIG